MKKSARTQENILNAARTLFWMRGYSNVSVRDVTAAAGVDAALVSRYFDGKLGLFKATLDGALDWPELFDASSSNIVDVVVEKLSRTDGPNKMSPLTMMMMNAADPDVGHIVRGAFEQAYIQPLQPKVGGSWANERVSLFLGAMIGLSMMRETFAARGVADMPPDVYAKQLRHMAKAALTFMA